MLMKKHTWCPSWGITSKNLCNIKETKTWFEQVPGHIWLTLRECADGNLYTCFFIITSVCYNKDFQLSHVIPLTPLQGLSEKYESITGNGYCNRYQCESYLASGDFQPTAFLPSVCKTSWWWRQGSNLYLRPSRFTVGAPQVSAKLMWHNLFRRKDNEKD